MNFIKQKLNLRNDEMHHLILHINNITGDKKQHCIFIMVSFEAKEKSEMLRYDMRTAYLNDAYFVI